MNQRTFFADGVLLLVAFIWGSAFVAQRLGMNHIEPWAFNGLRFLIGSVALIPLLLFQLKSSIFTTPVWLGGTVLGLSMMVASGLQQTGLIYTTAGKSAFITCLYIVIVPLLGLLIGNKTSRENWLGILVTLPGLALLTLGDDLSLNYGDMITTVSALFWAIHVLVVARLAPGHNVVALAFVQFLTCSLFSFGVSGISENWTWQQAQAALWPLLYVGVVSTGIAYTLQLVGQKTAPVAHASIILSMETVFAVLVGYFFLEERLSGVAVLGCALMLLGMMVSQFGLGVIKRLFWRSEIS